MRVLKAFLIFLALTAFFCIAASAESEDVADDILQDFYDALPEGEEQLSDSGQLLLRVGMDGLISEIISVVSDGSGALFSFFALLFGISVVFVLGEGASHTFGSLDGAVPSGIFAIGSVVIFSQLSPVIKSVESGLGELSSFFSSVMPIFSALNVASGNMNLASVQAFNMNLTLSAVGYGASSVLLPLALALFALALVGSMGGEGAASVAGSIRGVFNWVLGIATTVILSAVSMQSLLASSADAAYLRAAKYAASDIPIVGSTVSGALSTLAGGLGYVRSTVGIGAVAVIVSLSLSPLIMLLLFRLSFSLCTSLLNFFGCTGGVRCFTAFRSALDGVISIYALSAVIYVFEVIVFMKSGVTVFG